MKKKKQPVHVDPTKPLPSHGAYDFWEGYARNVLRYLDPKKYGQLKLSDKPDLIDEVRSIGVEVTSTINKKQQEAEALYAKYSFEEDEIRAAKLKATIEKTGAKVHKYFMEGISERDSNSLVMRAFDEKLGKLNGGGYRLFSENHLYIRSNSLFDASMLQETLSQMTSHSAHAEHAFNKVIIEVPGRIYCVNIAEQTIETISFGHNAQFAVGTATREEFIRQYNFDNDK